MIDKHYTNELNGGRHQCVMAPSLRTEVHSLGTHIANYSDINIYTKYMHSNNLIFNINVVLVNINITSTVF